MKNLGATDQIIEATEQQMAVTFPVGLKDPTAADTGGLILLSAAADGNMVITYIRRRDDLALTYTVQGTVTLAPPVWVDVQTWVLDEQVTFIDDA